ncbi:PGN_0703 family putative restriction endonuclease [Methylorubrum extorquens]|uniref:PGN_0703 family putative restriction endonuclease n=1 Tax=Methylorubrum extorquens TaxID=408 RepID=UPI002F40422C
MADLAPPLTACATRPTRAPLVPESLLRQYACLILGDTRFRAAARLRQSLWRQEQGLPAGLHRPGGTRDLLRLPLGSTLQPADAARGLNFLSPAVHAFVRRSLVLREEGAMVHYERLHRNLLSSEPLTYNLFVPLALNLDLATAVFRPLLPAFVHQVTGIRFETSPGRHDPRYLNDGTAFDAAISVITPDGEPATVFIEVKYSEGCTGPAATHRPRYDEASREAALHRDPDSPALRSTLLEQFWRLHLLAQLAVRHSVTPRAHLLVLYPQLNRRVRSATHLYVAELTGSSGSSPALTGFSALTLETFVAALAQAGGGAEAGYLHHRYLDLKPVLDLILAETAAPDDEPPPAGAPLALLTRLSAAPSSADASAVPAVPSSSVRKLKGKAAVATPRTSARSLAPHRATGEVR